MPILFGYGSLLDEEFTKTYTKLSYATLIPTRDVPLRRAFNVHCVWKKAGKNKGVKYCAVGLEVVPFCQARAVHGVLIEVTDAILQDLIVREAEYRQLVLPLSAFLTLEPVLQDGSVTVFIPKVSQYPTEEYPLNKDYIDICIRGFAKCSAEWADTFLEMTA